jgi:thiamine-monophosphate kinase
MIDVSDGIVSDLGHILEASQVAGVLRVADLPLSADFAQALRTTPDLIEMALAGGEDYELLFTLAEQNLPQILAIGKDLNLPLTCIGSIRDGDPQLFLQDAAGRLSPCRCHGYDHFAPRRGAGA